MEVERKFSAGSTPAPDVNDQFLENRGYYRKHTARDATCLFRVISEQVFDIQIYHDKVRADCVAYMREHRKYYEKNMIRNFDDYLQEMMNVRTFGTKLELEAMGHMYKRNIVVFEPGNTGKWFLRNENYNASPLLNVFYLFDGHRRSPEHYDSVFERDYIEKAALCQSIIYEILYTKVYKLPDVMLSVEHMLHDPYALHYVSIPPKHVDDPIVEKAVTDDGREFILDIADNTNCVLDDDSLCHFHNKHNFTEVVCYDNNYQTHGTFGSYDCKYEYFERKRSASMLPDYNKSCVRQLLEQNITPFPFKVAKTLDPFMYRNIEFDVWNEFRRMQRYRNWYYADGFELRVGSKCLVTLNGEAHYQGYIQEMTANYGPCIVYVEDLGEKITVPFNALKQLPADEIKPWGVPYHSRFQRCYSSDFKRLAPRRRWPYYKHIESYDAKSQQIMYPSITYKETSTAASDMRLKQYTSTQHFQPPPYEQYCVMPFVLEHNVKNTKSLTEGQGSQNQNKNNKGNGNNPQNSNNQDESKDKNENSGHQQPQQQNQPPQQPAEMAPFTTPVMAYNNSGTSYFYPTYGYPGTPNEQPYYYEPPMIAAAAAPQYGATSYFGGMSQPTGQASAYGSLHNNYYNAPPPPQNPQHQPVSYSGQFTVAGSTMGAPMVNTSSAMTPISAFIPQPVMQQRGGKEMINYSAPPSAAVNGSDIPLNDMQTVRYFYNLGIEYHRMSQNRSSEPPANAIEPAPATQTNEINQLSADVQSSLKIKIEDTSTTTVTSVSDNLTTSTNNSNSPLIKNENYSSHNNNWTYQRYPRRGGYNNNYRGNRRGNNDNNRHYNNNHHNNNNHHDNEGGFSGRNNRNHNNNNNNHEKPGGFADTPSNSHSISTTSASLSNHSLSPIVSSLDNTTSTEFSQVPYQPLYYVPSYYGAPETAGDVNQPPAQYIQYMPPQQPPHYNAIAPGMPPATVYIPQTMTGNNEMIMTNNDGGADPGSAPAYGYMNYPIIYGPPAPAAVAPPRPGNNAGYVWYPAQQSSGQPQMTSSANAAYNASGNISQ